MKKMWFKALCMVLVVALLAPNVFAATLTQEDLVADVITEPKQKEIDALFTELNEFGIGKKLTHNSAE